MNDRRDRQTELRIAAPWKSTTSIKQQKKEERLHSKRSPCKNRDGQIFCSKMPSKACMWWHCIAGDESSIKLQDALKLTRAWEAADVQLRSMSSHASQDVNRVSSSHAPQWRTGPARSSAPHPACSSESSRTNHRDHGVGQEPCSNCGRRGHLPRDPSFPQTESSVSTAEGSVILQAIVASESNVFHRPAVRPDDMRTTSRSTTSLTTSKMTRSTRLLLLVPMELFVSTFTWAKHRRQP